MTMIEAGSGGGKQASSRTKWKVILVLGLVAFAGLLVVVFFLWRKLDQTVNNDANNSAVQQRVIKEVAKLYLVPTDEKPTVGQISDHTKVEDQAFFANAQNGDYLIVYEKDQTALLYRESANKLIKVGSITIQSDQGDASKKILPDIPGLD